MTNPSNRTDVTDAMIHRVTIAIMAAEPVEGFPVPKEEQAAFRYGKDCALIAARETLHAMLTAQPQSGEVEPVDQEEVREVIESLRWHGEPGRFMQNDKTPVKRAMLAAATLLEKLGAKQ